jgi:uncharacterized protein (TIGR02270 family)
MIVSSVVQQHADDAAVLASNRTRMVRGPSARLGQLSALDRRLTAHLDGLRLAGEEAWKLCEEALETPFPGTSFPLTVRALETRDEARLSRVVALAEAVPETAPGLLLAFGWVEPSHLQGTVAALLAGDPVNRTLGVAACAMHRVDLGRTTALLLQDSSPAVRARAYRSAGELGLGDLLQRCAAVARSDEDPDVQFWAAWSGVVLGDRGAALDVLIRNGFQPAPHRERAFRLALQAMTTKTAHAALQRLAADKTNIRWVIQGSGLAGDPAYIPWLVKQMDDPKQARIAAEAFTFITGLDLGAEALDRPAPEGFDAGPTDDPDDPNVDTDPDDGLSWPDAGKIRVWWEVNGKRFQPGARYFMGEGVSRPHCIDVLKNGHQRQRIMAAHFLCLLDPGTPLFNTSAPAWRQQRLLAQTS